MTKNSKVIIVEHPLVCLNCKANHPTFALYRKDGRAVSGNWYCKCGNVTPQEDVDSDLFYQINWYGESEQFPKESKD